MSATLGMQNTTVTMTGDIVNVPNNPTAKLMYYLSCVASVIQYNDNIFTDYNNYYKLSNKEKKAVYNLASLLKPSLFLNAGFLFLTKSCWLIRIINFIE